MKLTYKKGKQDKIHISVDGEYSFTVDEAYFLSMGIYNGKEVESDELEEIKQIVSVRRAYNYAVTLLSRRDHSERELMTKLSQKGYTLTIASSRSHRSLTPSTDPSNRSTATSIEPPARPRYQASDP